MTWRAVRAGGRGLCGLAAWCVVSAVSAQGWAWEQTQTCTESGIYACRPGEEPQGVHWSTRSLRFVINERGSDDIERGADGKIAHDLVASIRRSFDTWLEPDCAELSITYGGLTAADDVGFRRDAPDNANIVMWREEWPYRGAWTAYALTSVTFSVSTGVISDADIELNGEYFTWSDVEEPEPNVVDVRNVLTHEVGHFIGLDHSEVVEATMFERAPEGETSKRTLHQDDIAGLCALYPPLPPERERRLEGCCAVVSSQERNHVPLTLVALGLFALGLMRVGTGRRKGAC